jgi:hypothetical protein
MFHYCFPLLRSTRKTARKFRLGWHCGSAPPGPPLEKNYDERPILGDCQASAAILQESPLLAKTGNLVSCPGYGVPEWL